MEKELSSIMKGRKFWKKVASLCTSAIMLATIAAPIASATGISESALSSVRVEEEAKIDNQDILSGGLRFNLRDLSFYDYNNVSSIRTRSALPEKYDLREHNLATPVRDQSPWGSCWSFGALAGAESNALSQGVSNPDYSELHLAWFTYQNQVSGNQSGEGVSLTENYNILDQGGNSLKAVSVLSSWQGIDDEANVPYQNNAGTLDKDGDWSVDESKRFNSTAHLVEAGFLPSPSLQQNYEATTAEELFYYEYNAEAVSAIKRAVMQKGAVNIMYYADQSRPDQQGNGKYFNYNTWSQYVNELIVEGEDSTIPNHSVAIVGWDDNYAVENFNEGRRPAQPGAWIVKNSWGTQGWGVEDASGENTGYFYLSYYDNSIMMPTTFEIDDGDDGFDYDNNYQYDYLGLSNAMEFMSDEPLSIANVFTATDEYQQLGAVSTVLNNPKRTVEVNIYKLNPNAVSPTDGTLVASTSKYFEYSGYYTIELPEPVNLSKGEKFSVVETIKDQAGNCYIIFEAGADQAQPGYDNDGNQVDNLIKYTSKINRGESFVIDNTGAIDLADDPLGLQDFGYQPGNNLIKAFTKNVDVTVPELKEIQISSYDKNGLLIGEVQKLSPSQNAITLSSYTNHISVIPVLDNIEANATIEINGREYKVNESIPRIDIKDGAQMHIKTVTQPEGFIGNTYTFTINEIEDTILTDGGVTMIDDMGYIPIGADLSVVEVQDGNDYGKIKEALLNDDCTGEFTLLSLATNIDGEILELGNGEGVTLKFTLPEGYDASKTQLYRVEITDEGVKLYAAQAEENAALSLNTGSINSYYVLAQKEIKTVDPGSSQPGGDSSTPEQGGDGSGGTHQTGDDSMSIAWVILIVAISGMLVLVLTKKGYKTVK